MRGWPLATIAFYGPGASRATKVVVSIKMRDWQIVGIQSSARKEPRSCGQECIDLIATAAKVQPEVGRECEPLLMMREDHGDVRKKPEI
jgi:hypothetical protein